MRSPLDAAAVRRAAGSRWPRIDVVDETTSTNADLLATAASRGDREVLVAEHQTSGRGRLDRSWTSPPRSGLLFSMLVRPQVPEEAWGWLPLLTGVALAEAVHAATGVRSAVKWPNDLLLGDGRRKAAGILVQSAAAAGSGGAVVIGIGLNVSLGAAELPVDSATSLVLEGARTVERADLLAAVLLHVDEWLRRWEATGGDAQGCGLAGRYRALCDTLGRTVRVTLTDGPPIEGVARELDRWGRVVVERDGQRLTVSAGDVEHLRPG